MHRSLILSVILALAVASCGASAGNVVLGDAGPSGDTGAANGDGGHTAHDSGTTGHDSGATGHDSGTPPHDAGPTNYGMCGSVVVMALCGCGASNMVCVDSAILTSTTCSTCVLQAQVTCCPTTASALQSCETANMCTDQTCITAHCNSQFTAYQTCLAATPAAGSACANALAGCFGSFPPPCNR